MNDDSPEKLNRLFQDALSIFQVRLRNLKNTERVMTQEDYGTLSLMLDALIETRKQIDKFME